MAETEYFEVAQTDAIDEVSPLSSESHDEIRLARHSCVCTCKWQMIIICVSLFILLGLGITSHLILSKKLSEATNEIDKLQSTIHTYQIRTSAALNFVTIQDTQFKQATNENIESLSQNYSFLNKDMQQYRFSDTGKWNDLVRRIENNNIQLYRLNNRTTNADVLDELSRMRLKMADELTTTKVCIPIHVF